MTDHIAYEQVDFVDYFARMTAISENVVMRLVDNPSCLAAIDAFRLSKIRMGVALHHVLTNLETSPLPPTRKLEYARTVNQIARRMNLPIEDRRSIVCPDDVKQRFASIYNGPLMSKLEFLSWLEGLSPINLQISDVDETWWSIRFKDEEEYLSYWQLANAGIVDRLINDRKFCAGLEASYALRVGQEPDAVCGMIDDQFAGQIPILSTSLRFKLYGRLGYRILVGLIRIPENLKDEFPEFDRVDNEAG